jgi:hypothetical protein
MPLPSIRLGNLEVSRMVLGTNPVAGFSHAGPDRTEAMLDYFTVDHIKRLLKSCEKNGVTAGVFRVDNFTIRVLREHWKDGGKMKWIAQTVPEEDGIFAIEKAKRFGASAVYVHGGTVDKLFSEGKHAEVKKWVDHIKKLGLPAGAASHNPQHILYMENNGFAPDFYMVCLYNIAGYMGKLGVNEDEKFIHSDREKALAVIRQIPRPCIAYKILACKRYGIEQGFRETLEGIKPIDGVNVGMFPPDTKDVVAENASYMIKYGSLSEKNRHR